MRIVRARSSQSWEVEETERERARRARTTLCDRIERGARWCEFRTPQLVHLAWLGWLDDRLVYNKALHCTALDSIFWLAGLEERSLEERSLEEGKAELRPTNC